MAATGLGYRNVVGRFYARLEELNALSWADPLSILVDSDQPIETYKWLGQTPAMREWIGGRAAKGLRENGITIENKTFESTMDISVDDLRRDKTGQINVRIDELAGRVGEHWHKLLTTLILNGTSANCYDGQYFFDDDHSEGDSGTQKNLLTATEVSALNISTTTAPTDAEFIAAIRDVIGYMLQYKDDQGEPMNANARSWLIMVPWNLWGAATAAVNNLLVGTNSTNLIASMIQKGVLSIDVISNPRLSSTASAVWYMFRTDASAKPLIRQQELFETGTEDQSFTNNRILFGVKALRNVGYGYWQYAAHCTFS